MDMEIGAEVQAAFDFALASPFPDQADAYRDLYHEVEIADRHVREIKETPK